MQSKSLGLAAIALMFALSGLPTVTASAGNCSPGVSSNSASTGNPSNGVNDTCFGNNSAFQRLGDSATLGAPNAGATSVNPIYYHGPQLRPTSDFCPYYAPAPPCVNFAQGAPCSPTCFPYTGAIQPDYSNAPSMHGLTGWGMGGKPSDPWPGCWVGGVPPLPLCTPMSQSTAGNYAEPGPSWGASTAGISTPHWNSITGPGPVPRTVIPGLDLALEVRGSPYQCRVTDPALVAPAQDAQPTTGTPTNPVFTPIESAKNLWAPAGSEWIAKNSVRDTAFTNNKFSSGGPNTPLAGTGRYHVDNQTITSPAETGIVDPITGAVVPDLFSSNGNPGDVEGPSDKNFTILGNDGYLLGKFMTPVQDKPGYDIEFEMAPGATLDYPTFCLYGAQSPTGPFTLVHSAFNGQGASASLKFRFDLKYFYTPLRQRDFPGDPSQWDMTYFLAVNSVDRTPYLKSDFTISFPPADPALAPYNPAGLTPLRGQPVTFQDTTEVFGYPVWHKLVKGNPDTYPEDPANTSPNRIANQDWAFPDDPYAIDPKVVPLPGTPTPLPQDRMAWVQDQATITHKFMVPGIYNVCHAVHTQDKADTGSNGVMVLLDNRQSDPPYADQPMRPYAPASTATPPAYGEQVVTPNARKGPIPEERPLYPDPTAMLCRKVTVYNLSPTVSFTSQQLDPADNPLRTFSFAEDGADVDWAAPDGMVKCNVAPSATTPPLPPGQTVSCNKPCTALNCPNVCVTPSPCGATVTCSASTCPTGCGPLTCPVDGIQSRCWYFDVDAGTGTDLRQLGGTAPTYVYPYNKPTPGVTDPRLANEPPLQNSRPWQYCWNFDPTTGVQYDSAVDAPTHTFGVDPGHPEGKDGLYRVTEQICDHDAILPTYNGPPPQPNVPLALMKWYNANRLITPNPDFARHPWGYYIAASGAVDPLGVAGLTGTWSGTGTFDGTDPTKPEYNEPRVFGDALGSAHGCTTTTNNVRVYTPPNTPPVIPPSTQWFGLAGTKLEFGIVAYDLDIKQVIDLHFCGNSAAAAGAPAGSTLLALSHSTTKDHLIVGTFKWDATQQGPQTIGPICFEVTDGQYTNGPGSPLVAARGYFTLTLLRQSLDSDLDGIPDTADNCPAYPNPLQVDANGNGAGNECDTATLVTKDQDIVDDSLHTPQGALDSDSDGISNDADNCPGLKNANQLDLDGDGYGDACDLDFDGDAVQNTIDNCPAVYNPDQKDAEHDGVGDACRSSLVTQTQTRDAGSGTTSPAKTQSGGILTLGNVARFGGGGLLAILLAVGLIFLVLRRWK